jgi:uncharacterized protein (TIGR03066 family)
MMATLRIVLSIVLVVFLGGAASTHEKKAVDKQKVVGTWELVKTTSSDNLLKGLKMEFTKEGKFSVWLKDDDKVLTESTYEVNGDMIKWKEFKGADNHEEMIKTLTDKELILVQKTPGDRMETHEFKRVK